MAEAANGGYRLLLRHPGAAGLAAAGLIGRLPTGMLGLTCVLVLLKATGSYAAGGMAAGLYLLATAVTGPAWSRLADRIGPRLVLLTTGCGQTVMLLAFADLASSSHGQVTLAALAAASGTFAMPLGAIMRTTWSRMLCDEPAAKAAAFAYESLVLDLAFIIGPAIVTAIAAFGGPAGALLTAAMATITAAILAARSPHLAGRGHRPQERPPTSSPLRQPAVVSLLPVGFLLTTSITLTQTSLVAFAGAAGNRNAAGLLVAMLSAGSIIGGLYYGNRKPAAPATRRLPRLLMTLAAGWATLALLPTMWLLGAALVLVGLALNPNVTAVFAALDETAPRDSLTESFAWLTTTTAAGLSTGSALAGLVAAIHPSRGFLFGAGACALAAALCQARAAVWRPESLARAASSGD